MKDFHDLFFHELNDIYAAELRIEKILPEMAKAAHLPKLKEAFHSHHKETKKHIERLEKIAAQLGVSLQHCECEAIEGILKEGKKLVKGDYPHEVRDAALIVAAQKVEHYEMAVYGILKAFARRLKLNDVVKILDETSQEEGRADKHLTEIANGTMFSAGINEKALKRESA
ncbi:MAG TPA: ferritin-like domain-containing protein [Chlamydiales bacterium]|nr:ferritin-like domain-containing protein [Chlamydiales bacterium]